MSTPRQKAAKAEQTFDLDQASAIRRDREAIPFHFTWRGDEFTCMPIKEWPLGLQELMAKGQLVDAMKEVLGNQADLFLAGDPSMGDVETLMGAIADFSGVGDTAGE